MTKYSPEFKKKVIFEYLYGHIGSTTLGKKYGISQKMIRNWIHLYQKFGDDGISISHHTAKFSFEFKLAMVESYLTNKVSYEELALANGIKNHAMISHWVQIFKIAGPEALRPHRKGRCKSLAKSHIGNKTAANSKQAHNEVDREYVKILEDQLLKLKIENAFLKELRRLRLEDEAKARGLHASSTVSEESSN